MLPTFLSPMAPQVVVMTTVGATSDNKVGITMNLSCRGFNILFAKIVLLFFPRFNKFHRLHTTVTDNLQRNQEFGKFHKQFLYLSPDSLNRESAALIDMNTGTDIDI